MKKLVIYLLPFLFVGCTMLGGGPHSEDLLGTNRKVYPQVPSYGMLEIPSGVFKMGLSTPDIVYGRTAPLRTVSVVGFWMDETEITNSEYLSFVSFMQEMKVREKLRDNGIEGYAISETKEGDPIDPPLIEWNAPIEMKNEEVKEVASSFYKEITSYGGYIRSKVYDLSLLQCSYEIRMPTITRPSYLTLDTFAEASMSDLRQYSVNPYPDTLCWRRDFAYAYNEPMVNNYFSDPVYGDYPVVGVSWEQASAFCYWRTFKKKKFSRMPSNAEYRLPTETEWEYAARGGKTSVPYPWGAHYVRNDEGCFRANFKPGRGDYAQDGAIYTMQTASYEPNDYGLFDMAGNVAEWTSTYYDEAAYSYTNDMNADVQYLAADDDPIALKRKVVKGGSFKDVAYFLQSGTRTFDFQAESHSYLGFRCVYDKLGE